MSQPNFRDRAGDASALNIFEFLLINENLGWESEAPAELFRATNSRTIAWTWCGSARRLRRSVAFPKSASIGPKSCLERWGEALAEPIERRLGRNLTLAVSSNSEFAATKL